MGLRISCKLHKLSQNQKKAAYLKAKRDAEEEKKGTAAAAADDDDDVHSYHEYDRLFSFRVIVQFRQYCYIGV